MDNVLNQIIDEIREYQSIHDRYCEHIENGDYWQGHTPDHYQSSGGKATACDVCIKIISKYLEAKQ